MSARAPLRCDEAERYLSAYVDGELDESLRVAVAEHVTSCATCAATVARYRKMDALLAGLPRTQPSPEVFARVRAATAEDAPLPMPRGRAGGISGSPLRLPGGVSMPGGRSPRRVPAWIPAAAAVLLIALSVALFSRVHPGTATKPDPWGRETLNLDNELRSAGSDLGFTPLKPPYLPSGARLTGVVTAMPSGGPARYVEMTWDLGDGATLAVREAPAEDGWAGFNPVPTTDAAAWRLSGHPAWMRLTDAGGSGTSVGVGQRRDAMTIIVRWSSGSANGQTAPSATVPRLVSLSFDVPYKRLAITPLDTDAHLLAFSAVPGLGSDAWSASGYAATDGSRAQTVVKDAQGRPLYTDVVSGGSAVRLDDAAGRYASIPASDAARLAPDQSATRLFYIASTRIPTGLLWNTGRTEDRDGHHVTVLEEVTTPTPTRVYVDTTTNQVVAVTTERASGAGDTTGQRPIAANATGCPAFLDLHVAESAPDSAFALAPAGYRPGAAHAPVACP